MKNGTVPQEKISALADGELNASELDSVLAALRQPEGRKEWDLYHQIGDVLRSDEMAVELSPGFTARMAAKLDAEPVVFAPAAQPSKRADAAPHAKSRFLVPGIAAALAAFTAYLVAPQLMTGGGVAPVESHTSATLASADAAVVAPVASASVLSVAAPASAVTPVSADADKEAVVLRDPNIDEYLIAHQRYSPSLYDTTQFVRSATFQSEPKK